MGFIYPAVNLTAGVEEEGKPYHIEIVKKEGDVQC